MARLMEITTPLGADVLLFHGMHTREELSRLSEYQIDLLSLKNDVKFDDLVGKNVTVMMGLPDNKTRYFNGFVTRFSQGGMVGKYYSYHAVVRPWLWFLTRTADCRIFQEMTAPDILKKVLGEDPHADFAFELTGSYRKWTYCVQYRETDFNFVSRLMEEEGLYYYFRHSNGHNKMVITDATGKHLRAAGCGTLPYLPPEQPATPDIDYVSSWDFAREIHSVGYVHTDYDFERPKVKLETQKALPRPTTPANYEIFDYPGGYLPKPDGTQLAGVRMDEIGTQYEAAHATTNARGLTTGCLLGLQRFPRADQNRDYLVLSSSHDLQFSAYEGIAGGTTEYHCSFSAMSITQQFRPARVTPKPFVQGPQTAVVVGPAGDEIHTDKYGRVKVQFFWDRQGKENQDSSCWIRVSSPWAGKNWGGISIPRMGQEVIVDFLEGDPDQPIITGRVYNAEQMPPYDLPANKTQSGVKSRSSLTGSPDNFNEIRFEDLKGSEQLFIHAEKNQDIEVENDETHWVGHDRNKKVDNDENTTIGRDRTETVHRHKIIQIDGNHSENIDGAMSVTIGKTLTENVLINYAETVGGAMEVTVGAALVITVGAVMSEAVGGAKTEAIGGSKTESTGGNKTLQVGKSLTESIKDNQTVTVGKDLKESIAGQHVVEVKKEAMVTAKKVQITADDEISLKTGDAEIVMKKNGDVTIKGSKITIKGSGDVIVKGSKIAEN